MIVDLIEYSPDLCYDSLPLAMDDVTLALQLGIRTKTLWWAILHSSELYKVYKVPKRGPNGGFRVIQAPCKRLKTLQRVLLSRFLGLPWGEHVGAYVLGRSCVFTAQQHTKKAILISMDIKDFFPSVKRSMVRRCLHALGYNHYTASLLTALMTYEKAVPQGAPTSGAIANLVADQLLDQPLLEKLKGTGWVYTRYSDDIDLSHPEEKTEEEQQQVINLVIKLAAKAGFKMKTEKTRIMPPQKSQRVLGLVVNEKVNVDRRRMKHVKAIIHNCLAHGLDYEVEKMATKSVDTLMSYVRGQLAYINQVDPERAATLGEDFDIALKRAANLSKGAEA